ncbi:MAG: hypothetical protein ACON5A_01150 [Candidatus Comchoanobacterales bacterium]
MKNKEITEIDDYFKSQKMELDHFPVGLTEKQCFQLYSMVDNCQDTIQFNPNIPKSAKQTSLKSQLSVAIPIFKFYCQFKECISAIKNTEKNAATIPRVIAYIEHLATAAVINLNLTFDQLKSISANHLFHLHSKYHFMQDLLQSTTDLLDELTQVDQSFSDFHSYIKTLKDIIHNYDINILRSNDIRDFLSILEGLQKIINPCQPANNTPIFSDENDIMYYSLKVNINTAITLTCPFKINKINIYILHFLSHFFDDSKHDQSLEKIKQPLKSWFLLLKNNHYPLEALDNFINNAINSKQNTLPYFININPKTFSFFQSCYHLSDDVSDYTPPSSPIGPAHKKHKSNPQTGFHEDTKDLSLFTNYDESQYTKHHPRTLFSLCA